MDITQYAVDKETLRVLYRFEIARFFEIHEPLTEQECIQYAARFVGEPVAPTPIQAHQRYGQQSYTVTAGAEPTRIVQFRRPPLDMELMRLARETYGRFVPKVDFIERLPDTAVFAYEADLVAGEAFSIAGCQLLNNDNYRLLDQTVKDFAEFFALGWRNPTGTASEDIETLSYDVCEKRLYILFDTLPSRFHDKIQLALDKLDHLFTPGYPRVVNHIDLQGPNIHVDTATGHVTGIVDWPGAQLGPFGMSLWGLESVMGIGTSNGWYFHPKHETLRRLFWNTFSTEVGQVSEQQHTAMGVARVVGLLLAYGYNDGDPVKEGDSLDATFRLRHLEAFLSV